MTRFIYKGFYYPVISERNIWSNSTYVMAMSRRFGGWANADKWWSFSYGIKVRLFNREKPYFKFVIDAINDHPEMILKKDYWNRYGYCKKDENPDNYNWNVWHAKKKDCDIDIYIGDISKAYSLTNLVDLRTSIGGRVICVGYDKKTQTAYGWSHRAIAGFKVGDKIYEESYNDPYEYPQNHGYKFCMTREDQMMAAINYAESIS